MQTHVKFDAFSANKCQNISKQLKPKSKKEQQHDRKHAIIVSNDDPVDGDSSDLGDLDEGLATALELSRGGGSVSGWGSVRTREAVA
mgnify:CR=1 FL=1